MTGRAEQAAWYWKRIDEAAGMNPDDPTGGPLVQNLISAAILDGVATLPVPVGDGVTAYFHDLVRTYREVPGGAAERERAERQRLLWDTPIPRRFRSVDPI